MENRKKGLHTKLLSLTLIPAVLVGVTLFLISTAKIKSSLEQLSQTRISDICKAVSDSYEILYAGDWAYDGSSFTKGGRDLYATYDLLDSIYRENNVHSTIFYGDTRIMTTVRGDDGARIVNTQAGEAAINAVLKNGNEYFNANTVIDGENYFSFYLPLKNSDGSVVGMFFAGVPSGEVNGIVSNARMVSLIALFILLTAAIVCVLFIALNLIKTLESCVASVTTMESGNLNVHAQAGFFNRGDELGLLTDSVNHMAERFRNIMDNIKNSSDVINGNANTLADISESTHSSITDVSRAIEDVANGAASQATDAQDAAINISSMGTSIEAIVEEINDLAVSAGNTQDTSRRAEGAMKDLIRINMETKTSVEKIVGQSELNVNAASRIQEAVNVISDIASQTNLLSLNASIEAARAGEQGRGFGVVALEVGKLAEDSSRSAAEIEAIIKELIETISETSELTALLSTNTQNQIEQLQNTQHDFNSMVGDVKQMSEKTLRIQDEIANISTISKRMEDIIESLSALSQENAAASEETTASANLVAGSMKELDSATQEIRSLAMDLMKIISYFHN